VSVGGAEGILDQASSQYGLEDIEAQKVEVTIPGAGLAPGVYVYEMEAANARFRGRLVRLE